ncbi:MAG: cytochrome b [Rhizobiaceae bacterium]
MLRNNDTKYGSVAIAFHWVIGLLFIGQIGLGWHMLREPDPARQFDLFQWHKSFGFLILALALLRLIWTLSGTRPDDAEGLAPWERLASRAAHAMLYVLMVAVPLSGWAIASASTLQIPSYVFNLFVMPMLPMAVSEAAELLWGWVHFALAYAAAAIALAHIAAALRHHFILHDSVLRRMMPALSRQGSKGTRP